MHKNLLENIYTGCEGGVGDESILWRLLSGSECQNMVFIFTRTTGTIVRKSYFVTLSVWFVFQVYNRVVFKFVQFCLNNNIYNNSHTEFDENEVLQYIQSGNSYSALEGKTTISLPILGRILISSTVLESWCNSAFKTVLKSLI